MTASEGLFFKIGIKVFENNIIEQLTFENKLYITDYIEAYKPSWYSYSYVEP